MKKLFSILLVVAMLACFMAVTVSAAEVTSATIAGSSATAKDGSATVTFTTSNASGFGTYKYVLTYDSSKLTVNSVSGVGVMSNTKTPGSVIVTFVDGKNYTDQDGNIIPHSFSVDVSVNENAKCDTYNIDIKVVDLYGYDENGNIVALGVSSAKGASVAVAHNYELIKETPATCKVEGSKYYVCSICGDDYSETLGYAEHTPGEIVIENEVKATCEAAGSYEEVIYCTVCGNQISREKKVVAGGHAWGDWTADKAATCEEKATEKRVCANCGEEQFREVGELAAHVYKKTDGKYNYGMNDTHHWYVCINCGHTTDEVKHEHNQAYNGYWWCECGHKGPAIKVDPGYDDVPKTGDITPYVTFGAVALISMAAAAAYVINRKFAK